MWRKREEKVSLKNRRETSKREEGRQVGKKGETLGNEFEQIMLYAGTNVSQQAPPLCIIIAHQ